MDPVLLGQPGLMKDYVKTSPPYTSRNDYGGVHSNSGIHNFAAYKIITARTGSSYTFSRNKLAAMFYIALTAHLSRTSQFSDSRRALVQATRSLFRKESAASLAQKVKAVEDGFAAAGIV